MTFPSDLEQKLGFVQIRTLLKNYCLSDLGVKQVDNIRFLSDLREITSLLGMNKEMLSILRNGEPLPFSGYFDPADLLPVIRVEGTYLEEPSFQSIILSLESVFGAKDFLVRTRELYPELFALTTLVSLPVSVLKKVSLFSTSKAK